MHQQELLKHFYNQIISPPPSFYLPLTWVSQLSFIFFLHLNLHV